MKKLVLSLTILSFLSCSQNKKQWVAVRDNPRFSTIFKFGYRNRKSIYLDSAIAILNDSLSIDKSSKLWVHDDTIESLKYDNSTDDKIPIRNVIFYNVNLSELKYIDSTYTSQNSIDSLITNFIEKIDLGGFYIYSDTLKNKAEWFPLFSTIDKVVGAYQNARENYSITKYGLNYRKIAKSQKSEVIKKIRMPIVVCFQHPFPPPPPVSTVIYAIPELVDTIK